MNDRKRMMIMLPILAVAGWLAFFGDKGPSSGNGGVIAPTRGAATAGPTSAATRSGDMLGVPPVAASAPFPVRDAAKVALKEPSPVNLFPSNAPPPPPPAPAPVNEEDLPPPPPAFRVIGTELKGGRLTAFLDKDNQTYVAVPGAVIDGNRVDVVKPDQVELFNLSTKSKQIIPIEGDK